MLDDIPMSDLAPHFYRRVVDPVDKAVIVYTLKRLAGNQVKAAETLGINRNTLRKRMRAHGLMPQPQETEHV